MGLTCLTAEIFEHSRRPETRRRRQLQLTDAICTLLGEHMVLGYTFNGPLRHRARCSTTSRCSSILPPAVRLGTEFTAFLKEFVAA